MKKYFLKNGKEVKFGDTISCVSSTNNHVAKFYGTFSKESLDFLKENNLISINNDISLDDIIDNICTNNNLTRSAFDAFSSTLKSINYYSYIHLMLKEISSYMNLSYKSEKKDNIWFAIQSIDFSIVKLEINENMLIDNLSLFRTCEDAKEALNILFGSDEAKN